MARSQLLNMVLNSGILLMNLINFSIAAEEQSVISQLSSILNNPSQENINYYTSIINSESAIYYTCASFTSLACVYSLVAAFFQKRRVMIKNVDFFLTLLSCCVQTAIGVLSGINNTLFQQNFNAIIPNQNNLNALQIQILSSLSINIAFVFPSMAVLLYLKWSDLSWASTQLQRQQFVRLRQREEQDSLKKS